MSINSVSSEVRSSAIQDATTTQTQTPQASRKPLPADSIGSTTSNECCLVKIWNAICNFFKQICSCLFGRSKQETNSEGTKPNERTKPLERNEIVKAGTDFMTSYATCLSSRTDYHLAVEAFKKLQPEEVQWQVLYLMVQGGKLPLGHIGTYVRRNKEINREVCAALRIGSAKDLRETTGKHENLRTRLLEFLESKVGILSSAPPSTQQTQQPTTPPISSTKQSKDEQQPSGKPASAGLPKAVQTFLESQREDVDMGMDNTPTWFKSDKCGAKGRIAILLYLVERGTIGDIHIYLVFWGEAVVASKQARDFSEFLNAIEAEVGAQVLLIKDTPENREKLRIFLSNRMSMIQ